MNFEREFGLKQTMKMAEPTNKPVKKQKTSHIDSGLQNILEMTMKKNKIEYIDILENLMDYNIDFFKADVCNTLSKKLPNEKGFDDIPFVDDSTPEFDDLTDADQVVQVFKKVKCSVLRMKAMYFAHTYETPCNKLLEMGTTMLEFFSTIKKNDRFKRWLQYILAFGNYMNGVGFYGGAYGFKLTAMKTFTEIKTTDDKRTLMEFVIETIGRNEKDRDLLDFYQDLYDIRDCKYNLLFYIFFIYY